ncbi:MAG TPA: cation-translocating P-type ATPase [Bryobacteraceae bacterium]
MAKWHQLTSAAVLNELRTDAASGLTESEAEFRLNQYGHNELAGTGTKSSWQILWEQLKALMVMILIVAATVSALLGDYKDAVAIGAIVVLNALLGFSQEYRAEKAIAALKKLAIPSVKVRRGGHVKEISASHLVPGDIVLLEAGNLLPADCRLLQSADLQTHEATLTGESEPIRKITLTIEAADVALGDRRNMAFLGTFITAGRGEGVVTETGMRTELGRIASLIQTVAPESTPLQRRLDHLGKILALAALALVLLIFALGLIRGEELKLLFLTAVSIGVAAVPEGLPAVVSIALTLGAQRMLRRNVLIRKLPAVETLGSITVICSDKTGTLTENRMTATILKTAERTLDVADHLQKNGTEKVEVVGQPDVALLVAGGALCNDAFLSSEEDSGSSMPIGDPTETALVAVATHFGLMKTDLERALERVAEIPFTSERKRMTTIHRLPSDLERIPAGLATALRGCRSAYVAFTKGAVDSLLAISTSVWVDGKLEFLSQTKLDQLADSNNALAKSGMRVLGIGFRCLDLLEDLSDSANERDLTFVGMVGMIDPPRPAVASAVARCKAAGIRPIVITGDHPLTAQYVAREVGIAGECPVLLGTALEHCSEAEIEGLVESTTIYARVSPEHKLKIVRALQNRGQIVAMTGDGVNDAPALRKADIGVAMGARGTDVAKETADMVLLDDNFATIVAAVEEGRVIYDNVRKFVRYILATNSGEIWLMLAAPFLGMPLPLLPLQILWMNLVTDGLPAVALGVEPAEEDTMRRPPRPPSESLFSRGLGAYVLWVGLLIAVLSLGTGYWYWRHSDSHWQTMLFTTLTLSQMAHVLAVRSENQSLFHIGILSNRALLAAVILTVLLQLALIYAPALQVLFRTAALSFRDLVLSIAISSVVFWAVEVEKWYCRHKAAGSI